MARRIDGRLFSRLSFGLCLFSEGYSLNLFGLYLPLRFMKPREVHPDEMMESWGFCYDDRTLHLNWAHRTKVIWMPWTRERVGHQVRNGMGFWVPYIFPRDGSDGRGMWKFSYDYRLQSGEVQHRTAAVYEERMRYVWRCLKRIRFLHWLFPWERHIDVRFSDEVGERSGSWKGGTIGCGCEMKPGETVEQTLRRMERERKF